MRTIHNQEYLIHVANMYSTDAVRAIKKSDYAKSKEGIVKQDINDFLDIIYNNDVKKYWNLDTAARDALMDILSSAFCFIDGQTLLRLSDIVINAIEDNNKVCKSLHNKKAIEALTAENKELQRINTMLCRYATTLDPELK